MKLIRFFLLTTFILGYYGIVKATTPLSIQGDWLITATLIATTSPNEYVHEGYTKQDTWRIQQQGTSATLSSAEGSIQGIYQATTPDFPNGAWYFSVEIPNLMGNPAMMQTMEIYIAGATTNTIKGASTSRIYINYGFGFNPSGLESFVFEGLRIGGDTSQPNNTSDIERLFNWAEAKYADLFSPKAQTSQYENYINRYYANTNTYLAVKDNRLFYLGPLSQNQIFDIGPFQEWIEKVCADGF
ncbi:MAG: hypothetical protein HQK77_05960 [Desulfobacterales bacterium]|nr:hypothetical protein [Desulfobacterales bacterium]